MSTDPLGRGLAPALNGLSTMIPERLTSRTSEPTPDGSRFALVLQAERDIRAPLATLRVLLEAARRGGDPDTSVAFSERAIGELRRAERAAEDLVAWTAPRPLRPVRCTVDHLIDSLRETLDPEIAERCRFAIDDGDTQLEIDARAAVATLERMLRFALDTALRPTADMMIHAHSDAEWTTLSLVDAPGDEDRSGAQGRDPSLDGTSLAEALMTRDVHRMGGRASLHRTGGHRCYVLVLPRTGTIVPGGAA